MPVLYNINLSQDVEISGEGLNFMKSTPQESNMVCWIPAPNSSSGNEVFVDAINGVKSSSFILNIGPLVSPDQTDTKLLKLCLNLLSMCSLVVLEKPREANNLATFDFLRRGLEYFGGDMALFKSSVPMPPLVLFSREGHLSHKESKKTMDSLFNPESGFSEEIGERNLLRNLVTSVFENREVLGVAVGEALELTDLFGIEELKSRLASIPPMEFQSLLINGPLLGHALESIVSDDMALAGLMTDAARQKVEDDLLSRVDHEAYETFASDMSTVKNSSPLVVVSMTSLASCRARAMEQFASRICKWGPSATAHKKSLQRRIRADLSAHEELMRSSLATHCRKSLAVKPSRADSQTTAYSDFLSLKNSIEKSVSAYNNAASSTEGIIAPDQDNSSAPYNREVVCKEKIDELRSQLLREYLVDSLREGVGKGDAWVQEFSSLLEQREKRKLDMKQRHEVLQKEEEELDVSIESHKRVAAETLRSLTVSLSGARTKQSSATETLESEVQSLVDAVERSSRLNEKEKAEMSEELMDIQKRVQVAQSKALELRQQREEQSNSLHQTLLDGEREGHKYMKTTYAEQHKLLSEELRLERDLGKKKAEHMSELFALEGEHIRQVEGMRSMAQREIQALREDHFRRRDVLAKDRDATVSMLRRRNIELEGKLNAAGGARGGSSDTDKGCSVM